MGALLALVLIAADPEPAEVAVFDPASRWRMTFAIEGGLSTNADVFGGASLELGVLPLRFVRLVVEVAGLGSTPTDAFGGQQTRGVFRLLGGVDGVLPLSWGELFAGIASGLDYSNFTTFVCDFCGNPVSPQWGPSLRLRAGVDVLKLRPLVVGVDVGYGLISRAVSDSLSTAQLRLRIGVVF